jgi:TolA-binding protein
VRIGRLNHGWTRPPITFFIEKTLAMLQIRLNQTRLMAVAFIFCATPLFAQTVEDDNRLAAGYYTREQWDESAIAFQALIDRYPDTFQAATGHFFLGESLMQAGKFGPAYRAYQIYLQRLPQHEFASRATFRIGEAAFRIGNLDQAIRLLEIFVQQNPHDPLNEFALPYLGEIRNVRQEPQLAQRAYETALRLYPHGRHANPCRLGLAKSLQMQGADAEAMRFYEFLSQQDANPLAGEAHLQIAVIFINQENYAAAQEHLKQALRLITNELTEVEAIYWMARTYVIEHQHARALGLLESIVGATAPEPLATAIFFDGAIAATKLDKNELALDWLTQLLDKYPQHELSDDALNLKIQIVRASDDQQTTDELVRQFIQKFPQSRLKPGVMETLGRDQFDQQKFRESIATFEHLLAEDQHLENSSAALDRSNWHYLKSLGHLGINEYAAAETELMMIDSNLQSEQLNSLSQIGLATARFNQKKFQLAIPNYRRYLQLTNSGNDALRARTELTVCLAESGRWDEVPLAFNELKKHHGDEAVVLETAEYLADKSNRENQMALAIRWYEFMAINGNADETIARGLAGSGWIKLDNGDVDGAMQAFDRLISKYPDSKLVADVAIARAKNLDENSNYSAAADMYGLVIRRSDNETKVNVARLRRAYALQKMGEPDNLQESKTLLLEYLDRPDAAARDEALYQLGWVNIDLKLTADGTKNFQELFDQHPDSKYWFDVAFRVAQTHVQQSNLETASQILREIEKRSNVPEWIAIRAIYLAGEIAAQQGQWETVSRTMQIMLERTEDERLKTKANYWLAEALYRQHQFVASGEIFQLLLADSTKADGSGLAAKLKPWIWLRLAQCQGQQNAWSDAKETAGDGKTRFPNFEADYEFDFVIARALEDQGLLSDARDYYQQIVDSPRGGATETAAISQWRIGETFFHQDEFAEAIQAYYKVDSLFAFAEWRSAAIFQAGKCQEHLGNWDHAQKLYKKLIELFPTSSHAASARKRLERVASLTAVPPGTEPR